MKRILVMICVLAMVFSLTACGGNTKKDGTADSSSTAGTDNSSQTPDAKDTDAGTGEAIRFAVCGPMTGDSAEQGLLQMNGCQMAVDEINAAGGVNGRQLDMVCYDDQASPNQAVIVAEKVAADPTIEYVISHINSGGTIAAQDVYIDAGLTVLAPVNTLDELSGYGWENFMRICLSDGASAKMLVDAMMEMVAQKPAVFYANTANDLSACNIISDYLGEKYGIADVIKETFNPETDRDYSSQVEKFRAAGVDCIILCCEYTPAALLMSQCHEKDYRPQTGGLACNNPEIISLGGEDVEGLLTVTGFDCTNPDEKIQEFIGKYRELYNTDPNDCSSRGYDTIYCVADAYKNGAVKENLAEWMLEKTDYQGVTCDIRFDGNCDNQAAITYILQIQSGAFTLLEQ